MNYQTLMAQADQAQAQAQNLRAQAEQNHSRKRKNGRIESWLDYTFESSSGLTPEFAEFSKHIRRELKKIMQGYTMLAYSRGHFEFSAFFKNNRTGNIIYISCSDVRFFPNGWYYDLLMRTAQHEKDYTGGSNNSVTWEQIKENADYLTK